MFDFSFGIWAIGAEKLPDSILSPIKNSTTKKLPQPVKESQQKSRKPTARRIAPLVREIQKSKFSPGLVISQINSSTNESGGTARIKIHLQSAPIAEVVLKIESSQEKEGKVFPGQMLIKPENWYKEQIITVVGQNDDIKDGNQKYHIKISISSDADFNYARLQPVIIPIENIDDENAGFRVGKVSNSTTEAGGTARFFVFLSSKPLSPVRIPLKSSNRKEGRLQQKELIFNENNWNKKQWVKIVGQNDDISDGPQTFFIILGSPISDDVKYHGKKPPNVKVINENDDSIGINTTTIVEKTGENKQSTQFKVSLNSKPLANVNLSISSSDSSEGFVQPLFLTFTPDNWKKKQSITVYGQNDTVDDGDQTYYILLKVNESEDPGYLSYPVVSLPVINQDNDTAGVSIKIVSNKTSEDSSSAKFLVRLKTEPTDNVKVLFNSNDLSEGRTLLKELIFTPLDWFQTRSVTVIGVNDELNDGPQNFRIIMQPLQSQDKNYHHFDPEDIDMINEDDDAVGVVVSTVSGKVTETGGKAEFTVRLMSKPFSNIKIKINSSDLTEGLVTPNELDFTLKNWNKKQKVTVIGQADSFVDGDKAFFIRSELLTQDQDYLKVQPFVIPLINEDQNRYSMIVKKEEGNTDEKEKAVNVSVCLNAQPKDTVIVKITSSDPTEGKPKPSQLHFGPKNWNQIQKTAIVGVNDDIQDGDQSYRVTIAMTSKNDPAFNSVPPIVLPVTNYDDDSVGVTVRSISNQTSEKGGIAKFALKLNSEPMSSVVFMFSVNDETEGKMLDYHTAFFKRNWNKEIVIRVKGAVDHQVDGDQPFHVFSVGAISKDPKYVGMRFEEIKMINKDEDKAGFVMGPVSGNTTEFGGKSTFTIHLSSIPSHNVILKLVNNDSSEGRIDQTELQFNKDNWNTPQTVTITGVDDNYKDNDQYYSISFAESVSQDKNYSGLRPHAITLMNLESKRRTFGVKVSKVNFTGDIKNTYYDISSQGILGGYVYSKRFEFSASLEKTICQGSDVKYKYNVKNTMEYTLNMTTFFIGGKYIVSDYFFPVYLNGGLLIVSWDLLILNKLIDVKSTGKGTSAGGHLSLGAEFSPLSIAVVGIEYSYDYVSNQLSSSRLSAILKYPF